VFKYCEVTFVSNTAQLSTMSNDSLYCHVLTSTLKQRITGQMYTEESERKIKKVKLKYNLSKIYNHQIIRR